jgi:DNA-binding FrmR family transcriptional regulator
MTHTIREKQKLLARVRRIRGQIEAIERALDGEAGANSSCI